MVDTTEYLTADAAKQLVLDSKSKYLIDILEGVTKAAKNGENSLRWYNPVACSSAVINSSLRELGYSVRYNGGDIYNNPFLEISW